MADFLEARLAEDETIAWEAVTVDGQRWVTDGPFGTPEFYHVQGGYIEPVAVSLAKSAAVHVARHDPAWVLRDIAAKRDAITAARRVLEAPVNGELPEAPRLAEQMLCALAGAYSDHDDFEPEWLRIVKYG
ncbi:hypothetical protein CH305_18380 [Rhodococcus sp. 15-649-2-2]|nr:hypothetical protein CH305_18380 [Rhodococcus sp. 15-649-2-2]